MPTDLLRILTYLGIYVNKLERALENKSHVNYANIHAYCIFDMPRSNTLSLSEVNTYMKRKANHSLPSCAEIQKTRSTTSTLPQPFMAWTRTILTLITIKPISLTDFKVPKVSSSHGAGYEKSSLEYDAV
jgi:hypothetical protein